MLGAYLAHTTVELSRLEAMPQKIVVAKANMNSVYGYGTTVGGGRQRQRYGMRAAE